MSGTTKASDSASSMIIALVCFSIRPRGGICWCCSKHKKPIYIPPQQRKKWITMSLQLMMCVKPLVQYVKHYIMLSFSHSIEFLFSASVWIHMPGATSQSNSYVHTLSAWQRCERRSPSFTRCLCWPFKCFHFFFSTPISCRLAGRVSAAYYVLLCFCSRSTSLLIQYA